MPSYRLTYFGSPGHGLSPADSPCPGRAELSRRLFAQGGVQFEDVRISFNDWPALKPKTPFGCLPILEIDGKVTLPESMAIARYIARETGQYGKDALEAAIIDAVAYALADLIPLGGAMMFAKSDEAKAAAKQKFEEAIIKTVTNLEKMMSNNTCGVGYFVGATPTMADIAVHSFFGGVLLKDPTTLDSAPKLKAIFTKVAALPNIKAYLAKRSK